MDERTQRILDFIDAVIARNSPALEQKICDMLDIRYFEETGRFLLEEANEE